MKNGLLKDIFSKFFKSDNEKDYEATELISACGKIGEINQEIEDVDAEIVIHQSIISTRTCAVEELNEYKSVLLTKRKSLVKLIFEITNKHKEK